MLQLDPTIVRDRLKVTIPAFAFVGFAKDLATVTAQTIRWPSAWVIPLGETAGDNRYQSCDFIEQTVTARLGVIMAIRDIADTTGTRAATDLQAIREAVLLSLCTFIPEEGGSAFRFASGKRQSGSDAKGGLFWQDDFTLRFTRRIQIT